MDNSEDKGLKALYAVAFIALILAGVLIGWIIHSIKAIGASYGM